MSRIIERMRLAWSVLWHGLPPVPVVEDEMANIRMLVMSPRSACVLRAVQKVLADPAQRMTPTVKRDEALEWATTYEYGAHRPWTWEHAFLLEYHVGTIKGRI